MNLNEQRAKPTNCQVEPPYPLASEEHVVVFSIRAPDDIAHRAHADCREEYPHSITDCGMFDWSDRNE